MTRSQIILGLDPGLAALGWGVVRSDGHRLAFVACGTLKSAVSQALALRLKALHEALSEVIAERTPDSAAVEETFVNADMRSALKLAQARAIALLAPAQAGIPVAEYAANLIKKSVVGAGHAGKQQIRVMVAHLLPGCAPSTDHEADALAVAITHAHLSMTVSRWAEAK
jgi:crossover junction endodeoxyribonuclease RuvC